MKDGMHKTNNISEIQWEVGEMRHGYGRGYRIFIVVVFLVEEKKMLSGETVVFASHK